MRFFLSSFALLSAFSVVAVFGERKLAPLDPEVRRFLNAYCVKCHGPEKEKGDRVFHEFPVRKGDGWMIDLADDSTVEILRDVLDQLNHGDMPPDDEGVEQPPHAEVRRVTAWLTKTLLSLDEFKGAGQTVLRRLNRNEYRNTMRDLLGLDHLTVDPTENFPADDSHEGFTNVGEALNLSDAHLAQYLSAADEYLDMAFHFGEPPRPQKFSVTPEAWGYRNPKNVTPWMYRLPVPGKHLDVGAGRLPLSDKYDLGTYPKHFANRGGVRTAGYYALRVSAEAIRRLTHPYDPKMIPTDLTAPMRLGLYVADGKEGLAAGGVKSRRRLASRDLKDHEVQTFVKTVWLAKGAIPFINWENGPGPSDYWMRDILTKYHKDVEFRGKQGIHAWHVKPATAVPGRIISDVWKGPLMRVSEFSFNGPLPHTFAGRAQREFLGNARAASEVDLAAALKKFARKAFRRPVTDEDVAPYLSLAENARANLERSPAEALRIALKAVLVSPDFLYLKETGTPEGRLTAHELANRLSYFLWSSMPDDRLFALADSGEITKPEVLRAEVDRMIEDRKANAFVDGFSTSWLQLDKLGGMPPDQLKFQEYYRHDLETAMREETRRFIGHVLRQNRPVTDFLDSDYTFLNQNLARHYGMDGVAGSHFRRVTLPDGAQRGGLLGHASVLTLSANGIDTSPVVRGVWVLEALLGDPPPPPPPDVEPLDPDVRGSTTIRERLQKHREIETCRDCHAKIDPFGFPLEFYDPVGGYRPTYYKYRRWHPAKLATHKIPGAAVDGSAKLRSGEGFHDPAGLKRALLKRTESFTHGLTEKLLTYACGRPMTWRDEEELKRITATCAENGRGFRDLLHLVVAGDVFQMR